MLPEQDEPAIAPTASYERTGEFVPVDTTQPATLGNPSLPVLAGYTIVQEIARGGMGCVWLARDNTLKRDVAIKTSLLGANERRFVTEAEVTAQLPHPAIPPVYALGQFADGSHYLVMKYIRGQTLEQLLQQRESVQSQLHHWLQVYEQVAQALGFAHAQGIIHRDVKPLNIMVGEFGDVQVMDWGLARREHDDDPLADEQPSQDADQTRVGTVLGTPSYMAPEQARGKRATAPSDVFALGGLLTVILTGQPTFVGQSLNAVLELAASGAIQPTYARLDACGADPELITLAKRCLDPQPKERPANGQEVARLVTAYRLGLQERLRAVEAAQLEQHVRDAEQRQRRRVQQRAWLALVAVLVLGVLGTTIGLVQALIARQAATAREADERQAKLEAHRHEQAAIQAATAAQFAQRQAEEERDAKEQQRRYAQAIADFVSHDFFALTTVEGQERFGGITSDASTKDLTLADLLLRAGKKLDARKDLAPLIEAELRWMIGVNYRYLGYPELAIQFLERSYDLFRQELGIAHRKTLEAANSLGVVYRRQRQYAQSAQLLEQVRAELLKQVGPNDRFTITATQNLARTYASLKRRNEALALAKEAHEATRLRYGADDPDTYNALLQWAYVCEALGQAQEALALLQQAKEGLAKTAGKKEGQYLGALKAMGEVYTELGQHAKAVPILEEAYQSENARHGPNDPQTMLTLRRLALAYVNNKQPTAALPHYQKLYPYDQDKWGPTHPQTLTTAVNMAAAHMGANQFTEAQALYRTIRPLVIQHLKPTHPTCGNMLLGSAITHTRLNDVDQARADYELYFQHHQAQLTPSSHQSLLSYNALAWVFRKAHRYTEAIAMFKRVHELRVKIMPANDPLTLDVHNQIGWTYFLDGKLDDAETYLVQTVESAQRRTDLNKTWLPSYRLRLALWALEKKDLPKHKELYNSWLKEVTDPLRELRPWGDESLAAKRYASAEFLYRETLAMLTKNTAQGWSIFTTQASLGEALVGQQRYADAEPILVQAYQGIKSQKGLAAPDLEHKVLDHLLRCAKELTKPEDLQRWQALKAKLPPKITPPPKAPK